MSHVSPVQAPGPAAGACEVRVVSEEGDLAGLRDRWEALLSACPAASPFQSLEWLLAWWKAYGEGKRLRVLAAERGGELVAALPLVWRRAGPFGVLTYLGTPRSDFVDALVRPGEEGALQAILDALGGARDWDVLWLEDLEDGAVLAGAIEAWAARAGNALARREGAARVYLTLGLSWEDYLAGRSRKFRQNLRRDADRLAAEGGGVIEWRRAPLDVDGEVETLAGIEGRSWKIGAGASRAQSAADRVFLRAILASLLPGGRAALLVLSIDGTPVAYLLELRLGGRRLAYNTAFDAGLGRVSPGTLLFARSIEEACRDGVREYDFLRGDEEYKARWTDSRRTNRDLVVWRRTLRGSAAAWSCVRLRWRLQRSAVLRGAAALLRRAPRLGSAARPGPPPAAGPRVDVRAGQPSPRPPGASPVPAPGPAAGACEVRVVSEEGDLAGLRDRWEALLSACPAASPFQSLEWLLAWWKAYGEGKRLRVLAAERGGELVAALPLVRRRAGPFGVLTYLGTPRSDFVDALMRPGEEGALQAILDALGRARDWDVLCIQDLRSGAALPEAVSRAGGRLGWRWRLRRGASLMYARFDASWEAYLQGRSHKFRQRLRRARERLEEMGPVEIVRLVDDLEPEAAVRLMSEIEGRSWKVRARADRFQTPADRAFALSFLAAFGPRRWARLWILRLAGNAISYVLVFRFRDRIYDYSTAFDQRFATSSPGNVLLARSMEVALGEGVREYDFLRGVEPYKTRWSDRRRENQDLVVWRRGIRGLAASFACARLRWAARGWEARLRETLPADEGGFQDDEPASPGAPR